MSALRTQWGLPTGVSRGGNYIVALGKMESASTAAILKAQEEFGPTRHYENTYFADSNMSYGGGEYTKRRISVQLATISRGR